MPRLYAPNPAQVAGILQLLQHLDRVVRPAERQVDVGAQELDVVADRLRHLAVDAVERVQRIVELVLLEVDPRQPKRGFVAHRLRRRRPRARP